MTAFGIDSALLRLGEQPLWPNFDARQAPIAYYDGVRTLLFRHPHPPAGFDTSLQAGVAIRAGRDASVTANTSTMLDGVLTATLFLGAGRRSTTEESASLAIHELFHVYERAHHPSWIANEADFFTYPFDDAVALALRREETAELRAALDAPAGDAVRCWSNAFVETRRARFTRLGPTFAAYERGTELNEGLAQYVERRSVAKPASLPVEDFASERVRERSYATGEAIARLLDRLRGGWRETLDATPPHSVVALDSLVAQAVLPASGGTAPCEIPVRDRAAYLASAQAEVADLAMRRSRALADVLNRPGPRLVVDAGDHPFQPQGFDPLNVRRVSATEIVHSRFVRLANEAGGIEVLDQTALTSGMPGGHPLFSGVRRVIIAGLPARPLLRDSSGTVILTGAGVSGRFRGATVDSSGTLMTIRLP